MNKFVTLTFILSSLFVSMLWAQKSSYGQTNLLPYKYFARTQPITVLTVTPINKIIFSQEPFSEEAIESSLSFYEQPYDVTGYVLNGNTVTFNNTGYSIPDYDPPTTWSFGNQPYITYIELLAIAVGRSAFTDNPLLQTAILPVASSIGSSTFLNCLNLTTIYLPSCLHLGSNVEDDEVFSGIVESEITLTIPAALMTCNEGNPDGDIQYLIDNNATTIIQVP